MFARLGVVGFSGRRDAFAVVVSSKEHGPEAREAAALGTTKNARVCTGMFSARCPPHRPGALNTCASRETRQHERAEVAAPPAASNQRRPERQASVACRQCRSHKAPSEVAKGEL